MNEFMNNISFSQIVSILAKEAEKYADEKTNNPSKVSAMIKKNAAPIEKRSLWDWVTGFLKKKEEKPKNTKKLSSKKI